MLFPCQPEPQFLFSLLFSVRKNGPDSSLAASLLLY